jgi:hypothetical protein
MHNENRVIIIIVSKAEERSRRKTKYCDRLITDCIDNVIINYKKS